MKTNALVIYAGAKAPNYQPNLQGIDDIEYIHYSDYPAPSTQDSYNLVIAHHCLPLVEANDVLKFVIELAGRVKLAGELWLITPSLEMIMNEIEKNQPNRIFHTLLFGSKNEHHRSAYTLYWLRGLVESAGMVIYAATQEVYTLHMNGKEYMMLQNHVIGHKIQEMKYADEPAVAIITARH
ncbi:MAG TPA: hypothetical protein PKJ08_00060 [Candidatus Cloacimonadota bacterium]|nr:hypothetical protein [Candidatus Cloacimonadota bacterium]